MENRVTSMSLLFVLVCLLSGVGNAATITRMARQVETTDSAKLIGYHINSGTYESWDCRPGSAWQTYGTIGRCCSTARPDCFMATTCISGSIMANSEFSSTCTGSKAQTSCVTGTVYRTLGDEDPIMNYQCWPEWAGGNWEAVRTTAVSSTTNMPTASASSGSAPSSSVPSRTATPEPSLPNTDEPEEEKSKAWVAGPVIGGVAGLAIIAGLAFWFRRRKAKSGAGARAVEMSAGEVKMPEYSERYAYLGSSGGPQPPRYSSEPVEVPGRTVHEMDGGMAAPEADGRVVERGADGK